MPSPTSTLASLPRRGCVDPDLFDLIQEQASAFGTKSYIEHARDGGGLSFQSLARSVVTWSEFLDRAGVADGAIVALVFNDSVELAHAFLATMAAGRWAAPLDPRMPGGGTGAMAAAIDRVQADIVLADHRRPAGLAHEWLDARDWMSSAPLSAGPAAMSPPTTSHSGGAVLASSGTTGAPKVITLRQEQLLHTARCVAEHHDFRPSDRGFNPLPLFHINAQVVGLLASLVSGSCLVLDDRFHRTGFWALMAERQVTWINAVPAIISRLVERNRDEVVPSPIRFIRSASAPLPVDTLRRFEASTGIPIIETYGMTEAGSQITANPLSGVRKPGSVGLPVGIELRIVSHGSDLPARVRSGTIGHVEIRGPSVISAYGGDLHRERFDGDGWLQTGDLGHFDEDGYLYLDARSDDVINRGGEKVFPREIEELLLTDPDIAAVSVIGEPDPVFGQVPVAYLVIRGADEATDLGMAQAVLTRIHRHLATALVRSKRPVSLRVIRELPAGANGKVRRHALHQSSVPVLHRLDCR